MLVERFWQDFLNGSIPLTEERLHGAFSLYDMPLNYNSSVLPILISIEQWSEELNEKEEIFEYAIRRTAIESMLAGSGGCILEKDGFTLALVYLSEDRNFEPELINERCKGFIKICNRNFKCDLSCYIGRVSKLTELIQSVDELFSMEINNISETNCVITKNVAKNTGSKLSGLSFLDCSLLLEVGRKNELLQRINDAVNKLGEMNAGIEPVEAFYHGVLNILYQVFTKKGLSLYEILSFQELRDISSATRSLKTLRSWALNVMTAACDYIKKQQGGYSSVIVKVCNYIEEHYHEDLLFRPGLFDRV